MEGKSMHLAVAIFDDDPDQEAVENDEDDACDPESNINREVDFSPVGCDWSKPPGTEKMKKNGNDDQ